MTQEKYVYSSHSAQLRCQKYLRPQSTRESRDQVKQQNVSKLSEVTILLIFLVSLQRRHLRYADSSSGMSQLSLLYFYLL